MLTRRKHKQTPQVLKQNICLIPVKSTLPNAVKNGNFATSPGITSELITSHLQKLEATIFGQFNQTRRNLIQKNSGQLALDMENYFFPKRDEINNCVFAAIGLETLILENYTHMKLYVSQSPIKIK